jgi:hypothetical protein
MARRVSQRERTQEAHLDDAPLTKRQQLEEDRCSRVPKDLGNDRGRADEQVNTMPQFVVFFFFPFRKNFSSLSFFVLTPFFLVGLSET